MHWRHWKSAWSWYSPDILHRTGHMLTWYLCHFSGLSCTVFQHLHRFCKISLCLGFISCCCTRLVILSTGVFSIYFSFAHTSKTSFQNALFGRSVLLKISFCDKFPLKIVSPPCGKWTNANFVQLDSDWPTSFSWALQGPYCVYPRHPVLHFEWVNVPGQVVTNDETSSPPLCWSCGLIPKMHLPNYYETGWINLLGVEYSPSKYWPMSTYQVDVTSVCYVYQKIVFLMIPHTNLWWFRT